MEKRTLEFDVPFNDEEDVKKLNDLYPDMIEPFRTMKDHVLDMLMKIQDVIHEVGDEGGWYMGDGIKVKVEIEYDEENK